MAEVEVRLVCGSDWERWRDIRLRALQDSPTAFGSTYARELAFEEADWRSRVGNVDGPAVLALAAGRPVGMGGGYQDLDGWLHVVGMWVDPGFRGEHVGSRVLDRIVGWAREYALRTHLDVTHGNDAARRLYAAYGFVVTGESEPLRPGSPERSERMVLPP